MESKFKPGMKVKVIATDDFHPDIFYVGSIWTVDHIYGWQGTSDECISLKETHQKPYSRKFIPWDGPVMSADEYNDVIAAQEAYEGIR